MQNNKERKTMAKEEVEVKLALSNSAYKTTCKVLSIFAKIGEVLFIIAAIALAIAGIMVGGAQKDIDINGAVSEFSEEMGESFITISGSAVDVFLKKSHSEQIAIILAAIGVGVLALILTSMVAKYAYRLFKNLGHDRTPFKAENVDYLQKMAMWLFISLIVVDLASIFLQIALTGGKISISISLSYYVLGFVLLALAVIFKHGCDLEQKTKK